MDAQAYSRMRPLYEAMTVCSAAIEWFERQERERTAWSLQSNLGDLVRVMEEFTAAASERDLFAGASTGLISGSVYCLEIMNSMTQLVTGRTRQEIEHLSERFREPVTALLEQVESLIERVEEILDAWRIALDDDFSGELRSAVEQIDRSKSDIPDWRRALELIRD
jgi:hypothetical protein